MADTPQASASSVTMCHTASRALVAEWHIVTCHVFHGLSGWSVGKALLRHAKALGIGSLRIVLASLVRDQYQALPLRHTLRFYITPHFVTWQAVARAARLVPATASPLRVTK